MHLLRRLGQPPRGAVRERVEPRSGQAQLARGPVGALELGADPGARLGNRRAQVLEPRGQPLVRVRPCRQRHRGIRCVADERVPEAKRTLTGDEREGGAHELAPGEQLQRALQSGVLGAGDQRLQPADVEGLPLDRARLDDPALGRPERVEARGEQRVQRRRERAGLGAFAHVGRQLLEEQRVAARPRDHPLEGRGGQRRPGTEQAATGRARPAEPAAAPRRAPMRVARSSSSGRPTQSSSTGAVIGPPASWSMRSSSAGSAQWASSKASTSGPRRRQRREEHPEGPRRRVGRCLPAQPERGFDRRRRPAPVVGRGHDRRQRAPAQRLEHHLAQRPVGDPVAVGRAVSDEHLRIGSRARGELADEARLADPGLAHERHQLRAARPLHPRQGAVELCELALAPDQRRHVGVAGARGLEQRAYRRAHAQLPHLGLARQPRRGADHLARGEGVALGHERGPDRHADADVQAQRGLGLELAQPALERGRGPHRTHALVLVAGAGAEDRHEPVGELLDHRLAMAPEDRHGRLAAAAHHVLEHLRIQRLASPADAHVRRDADHLAPRRQRLLLLRAVEQREQRRRGRQPEVLGQLAPRGARGGQRLGPATAELQRVDQLHPERLAQGVLRDERRELAEHALVAAQREVGVDARAEAGESQLVQARDLGARRTTRSASRARPDLAIAPSPRAARRRRRRGRRGPGRPRPPPSGVRSDPRRPPRGRRAAARSRPPAT